jgi:hypothetical protein
VTVIVLKISGDMEEINKIKELLKSFDKNEFRFTRARSDNNTEDYTKQYSDLEKHEKDLLKADFYKHIEDLLNKN